MDRIWKDIQGFEGLYQVSNFGEIKALERFVENNGGMQKKHERILKQHVSTHNHYTVTLCKNGKTYPMLVHRIVATAFIPNPYNKPVVDHIDTNPQNNCVNNLRWVTVQENCMNPITRVNNSKSKQGHPYYGRKLTDEEKEKISKALRGKKLSDEHRKKLSESHKNSEISHKTSIANIQKAIQSNCGKQHSKETRDKIRDKMVGKYKGRHWKIIDGKRTWID